ncbi:hypothetical protein [Streptomyces sp. GbtcB6]|uniref:hypothetical protein n=1 Tax=Streptomyces sp. GbtcB6 TaxID=2824751 RepID=UPI001C300751|nr:hypothetical protein [Streptomyces sp. GbtcB6]
MPDHALDAHVRFDTHPARTVLAARGFEPLGETTMVLARIDHEEPYGADQVARILTRESITVVHRHAFPHVERLHLRPQTRHQAQPVRRQATADDHAAA